MSYVMCDFKDKRSGKKGIEREIVVTFPSFQCRVTTHKPAYKHHIENHTAKKLLTQFFGLGLTHAPIQTEGFERGNT